MLTVSLLQIFSEELAADDLILLTFIVTVLLMIITVEPLRRDFQDSLSSMYRFKSADNEIRYPASGFFHKVLLILQSCLSFALMCFSLTAAGNIPVGKEMLHLLNFFIFALLFYLLKIILYLTVNGILYKKGAITVKPSRWNGFFTMVFAIFGALFLVIPLLIFFFRLPGLFGLALAVLIVVFMEVGVIYKLKSALFKNEHTGLSFFFYLCALEFSPLALAGLMITK